MKALDFEQWWWLEQEKKRLERNKRVKATRLELAHRLIALEAQLRQFEIEEEAREVMRLRAHQQKRPRPRIGAALVRELGLQDKQLQRNCIYFSRALVDDEQQRMVSLSVSSDEPYERSFGVEILDHSPKSIRMGRMNDGAPLLFNHNPDNHIGTILRATTDGKKLKVQSKFGTSDLAQQKLQDIRDGLLTKASIGYVIHDMVEERKGVFRATKWEPYEASLVTVPADPSVGVGRSFHGQA